MRNKQFAKQFGKQKEPKKFYRRLIGFLVKAAEIRDVKQTIRDAFTLLYSQKLSKKSLEIYERLTKITVSHQIDKEYEENSRNKKTQPVRNSLPDTYFHENHPNNFFAPKLENTLISIFSKIPLCSLVMDHSFGRTVKNQIRVDTWLETHLRFLQGRAKLGAHHIDDNEDKSEGEAETSKDLDIIIHSS